jgi:hypothetical protein
MTRYRKNICLDEVTAGFVDTKSNISKYIRELIACDMNKRAYYTQRQEELHAIIREKEVELVDAKLELKNVEEELDRIDRLDKKRPDGYDNVIQVLFSLKRITQKDWKHQANRLGVRVDLLKHWLLDDGVYDELLSR